MDVPAASDRAEKPWDHPWTTDEMREKRTDWNLAGDSGLLQHLQQFSDKLMTTANKTQEALNSLTSELDDTIIFIDNITNTSLALANTQFIESRVCDDEVDTDVPQGEQLEAPKTKEQLDAELIASIGESVRRGIAIMEEKYETVEVVASDSEDEGEIPIPSIILRPKDPYQDRPLPYIIGSEKWKNSSTIGLETSSSESEHQDEDESDSDDNIGPSTKPVNLPNQRIARLSSSSSESNDYATTNNILRHPDDSGSNKNQDIFDSESEATTAANSLPKNSSNAAPNFAEELAKRLGTVAPMQKSINTQIIGKPVLIQSKDDLFTPEDDDLFGAPSKNVFNEPTGLFDEESGNSLWNDKSTKPFKSTVIPPSIDVPPPMNDVSTKPKSALDDLFGDADSEDSDDIFSGKTSTGKSFNQNNSPSANLRTEEKRRTNNLLSVGGLIQKEGMTTSTPEANDISNSLFDNDSEDVGNLFHPKNKLDDWTRAKTTIPDKTAGSTPAEASDTNNRKKPIGGVSILGHIDIFASGKLRRQASSDSSSSKSSSDFDTSRNRSTTDKSDTNSVINNNSADGNSVFGAVNMETAESSGISLRPPSIEDVTTGSNISAGFQPQMTSTWNKTGDMYRERIASDSLFAAKTLDNENENSLNNARINEVSDHQGSEPSEEIDDIFGPPPLPKTGTKPTTKSKVSSLFDDSDSGDDLFSNTSSGSRSQKSADLLTTTTTTTSAANSQSSEKSKKIRNKGLFDDDDDEGSDLFGSKDSPQVNLFAAKATTKDRKSETVQEASASLSKDKKSEEISSVVHERLDTSFERQNTVKISQASPITKLGSIFDDLDDDDLFSPSFKKKTSTGQKAVAPSLFDDRADDLFAVPAKSGKQKLEQKVEPSSSKKSENVSEPTTQLKIGGEIKSKVMEQLAAKLEVVTTGQKKEVESDSKTESTVDERSVNAEKSTEEKVSKNQTGKNIIPSSDNESKVLASKILDEIKTVRKSKIDADVKPGIPKKPEVLKKLDRKLEAVNKAETRKDIVSSITAKTRSETVEETQVVTEESSVRSFASERRISSSEDERSSKFSKAESVITDHEALSESSVSEESSGSNVRRDPPKTLEIRSSTTSVSSEKSSAVQRRVVSGKIKNLMGRMSDLKIMSPTDTPPVFRKNEERVDEEGDKDSEDGSGFSTSKESPTLSEEIPKLVAPPSPPDYKELEPAISFDQPVQVETLSVTASKSRVRIQSKRRPQSRRARQNALRKSGIDFETDDFSNDNNSDTNRNLFSINANNNPTSTENSANAKNTANSNTDRLIIPTGVSESVSVKVTTESSSSTFFEDRSELSFSKESSLSINKNTLLSPSTDEEDLFDVPPDLPEDPPKEDALFGRAPILSPVESFMKVQKNVKQGSYKSEKRKDGVTQGISQSKISTTIVTEKSSENDTDINIFEEAEQQQQIYVAGKKVGENPLENEEQEIGNEVSKDEWKRIESKDDIEDRKGEGEKVMKELSDPLRDTSHDPLKDPSNLFPFVTKTPSPEKGKNLLFNEEDDSLFSSSLSKKDKGAETVKSSSTQKKQTIDLFADDTDVDFFAASLPKPARKSQKESKLNLFGDDDKLDDDLFDVKSKKSPAKSDLNKSSQIVTTEKTTTTTTTQVESSSSRKQSLFDESSDEQLFGNTKTSRRETKFDNKMVAASSSGLFSDDDSSEIFTRSSKQKSAESTSSGSTKTVKDIFRDQSSGEEDMFAAKKTVIKKSTVSSGLFGNDDDDDVGDIFGKSTSSLVSQSKSSSNRGSVVKKTNTRDLRKTAEKIVEDPLSMLQKD